MCDEKAKFTEAEAEIVRSSVIGKDYIITRKKDELSSGEFLIIDNNTIMHNKHLSFTCNIDGDFAGYIRIGHGRDCYSAVHMEIDKTNIRVLHHYSGLQLTADVEHGLDISDFLTVNIDAPYGRAKITVMTASGMYQTEEIPWSGRQGQIFAAAFDMSVKDVKINWFTDDYRKTIYLFGDSYFNTNDPGRWPYYLKRDGFLNCLMSGFPGMGSQRAIVDFKLAVERGTPRYAVWCMGMNNGDKEGKINPDYLAATEEFLKICGEKGITPILSTIPSTPKVDNTHKNKFVVESGHRYIDFNRAVGADKDINWYPEMLYTDQVHPAKRGAEALYMQVLVDFPEIMQR